MIIMRIISKIIVFINNDYINKDKNDSNIFNNEYKQIKDKAISDLTKQYEENINNYERSLKEKMDLEIEEYKNDEIPNIQIEKLGLIKKDLKSQIFYRN